MSEVRIRVDNVVDDYMAYGDVATENANMSWSPNGLLYSVGGEGLKKDTLRRMEEAGFGELAGMHAKGQVHIHDLSLGLYTPYCVGLSLENLIHDGITEGACQSSPAKHLNSLVNHMVNTIGSICNEVAGAIAFNNIDLYLAPYAYKCYLDYKKAGVTQQIAFQLTRRDVKQAMQNFIWHLNFNNRWGGQSPFSNITLAITVPDDMRDRPAIVGGKAIEDHFDYVRDGIVVKHKTYGDLYHWQRLVSDIVLDVYLKGDNAGRSFTFPVLTVNLTKEFFEHEARHKVWELTAKFGTPQFQNFINGTTSKDKKLDPSDVRSMCCRLNLDVQDLKSHTGGLFGNSDSTGSIQVVTLSLPFIAMEAKKNAKALEEVPFDRPTVEQSFFAELERTMDLARDEQLWKRQIVTEQFKKGFFPMTKANLPRGFDTFFTTIGFIGLFEAVQVLMNDDRGFLTEEGMKLGERIMEYMQDRVHSYIKDTGKLFNLEATPAESASYKLARKALKEHPGVAHRGLKKAPYFTNSCHIPVELQSQLDLVFMSQSNLQVIPSGGTVTHFYCGEDLTPEEVESAVKCICQTPIPFFSLSVIFSVCKVHGRIAGAHEFCPLCTEATAKKLRETNPELVVEA